MPALGAASPDVSSNSRAGSISEPQTAAAAVAAVDAQPVRFEPNLGQAPAEVRFVVHGPRFSAALTDSEFTIVAASRRESSFETRDVDGTRSEQAEPALLAAGLRMRGGDWSGEIDVGNQVPGVSNYLIGDRSNWVTRVPGYASLTCRDVYPGIDVVFRGSGGDVEYDVIVKPGADPGTVQVELEGPAPFKVDEDGSIVMVSDAGTIRHSAPFVYQETDGVRTPVAGRYVESGSGVFGVDVESFDASKPLVIDPVLSFSTYLGGGGSDLGIAVDVDRDGRFYVCGTTSSTNFTTFRALQLTNHGMSDVTITKFTQTDDPVLVYSTYLGGSSVDNAKDLVVDRHGNPYLVGETNSVDFPTVNPLQVDSGDAASDCFVAKLNDNGDELEFSTYLGGNGIDLAGGLAVDRFGNAYVTGTTWSSNFPRLNAIQFSYGGSGDAFVTGIEPDGSALRFSTYLGGAASDSGYGVAIGDDFGIYLAGSTSSANFPVASAEQPLLNGVRDAYLVKLGSSGVPFVYSTYVGGSASDEGLRIAVDGTRPILAGITVSVDFPLLNALQSNQLEMDVFVARYSSDGQSTDFSSYLGGNGFDVIYGLDVGVNGHLYMAGGTTSTDFRTLNFIQTDSDGAVFDAFVTEINPDAPGFVFSTYLGGSLSDVAVDIAVSGSGAIFICGYTESTNFPVQNPTGTDPGDGLTDMFVVRLGFPQVDLAFVSANITPNPVVYGRTAHITFEARNLGPDVAGDTVLIFLVNGLEISSYAMTQGDAEIQTLVPGYHLVTCYFGAIEPGATFAVTANGTVPNESIDEIQVQALVESSAFDLLPMNSEAGIVAPVVTITPPDITAVSSLVVEGKPYRIRITGSNFQPGVQVFVGTDVTPWPSVKYKNTTTLILKGSGLKARFPKGVAVQVRVVNPDTGSDSLTFVR